MPAAFFFFIKDPLFIEFLFEDVQLRTFNLNVYLPHCLMWMSELDPLNFLSLFPCPKFQVRYLKRQD